VSNASEAPRADGAGLPHLLRDDALRHQLAAAARARALEHFTVDTAISAFDEIYSFIGSGRALPTAEPAAKAADEPAEPDTEPAGLLPWRSMP
jgi:hypothetical protein